MLFEEDSDSRDSNFEHEDFPPYSKMIKEESFDLNYSVVFKEEESIDTDSESSKDQFSDEDVEDSGEWSTVNIPKVPRIFGGCSGIKIFPKQINNPADIASLFVDDDVFEIIALETNRYHLKCIANSQDENKSSQWVSDTTIDEIKKLFALLIIMGQVRKPKITDYWSRDPLIKTNIFPKTMSKDRFFQLLKYLCFENNEVADEDENDISKIKKIIDYFNKRFQTVYKPKQDLFMQENVIPLNGKINFKAFNETSYALPGITTNLLCEADTGYICNIKLYPRKKHVSETSIISSLRGSSNVWHNVYFENCQINVSVAKKLYRRKISICGPIKKKQIIPKELKDTDLELYNTLFRQQEEVLLLSWRRSEKLRTYMISTIHDAGIKYIPINVQSKRSGCVIPKPKCVMDYDRHVRLSQNYLRKYAFPSICRKSDRLIKKTVLFLFNCALSNALKVYNVLCPQNSLKYNDFLLSIARVWLNRSEPPMKTGKFVMERSQGDPLYRVKGDCTDFETPCCTKRTPRTDPEDRLSGDMMKHIMVRIYSLNSKTFVRRRCRVCSVHNIRKDTNRMCRQCKVPLHIGKCFHSYHTKKIY